MNTPYTEEQERENLPDKIYAQIVDAILRGEFREKGKLPTEAEFAEHYGVSRPTVREALFRLRSDGIIASRRGSGSYVIKMPQVSVSRFAPIESIADIERYYTFRMCVESGAAALAAEKRNEQDLQQIRQAFEQLTSALQSGESAIEEDLQFHMAIANASHNQFFVSTIEFIVGPIRQCMELSRNLASSKSNERREQVQREHQAIMEAIANQQPTEASAAMHRHIDTARRRIFEGA